MTGWGVRGFWGVVRCFLMWEAHVFYNVLTPYIRCPYFSECSSSQLKRRVVVLILNRMNGGPIHEAFLGPSNQCPLGSPGLCGLFSHYPPWAVARGGPAWLAHQHRACGASGAPARAMPEPQRRPRDRRTAGTPTRGAS